jgi:hypothetical protein
MTIRERFGRLSLWNKLGAVGSVCSVLAFAGWLLWPESHKALPSTTQNSSNNGQGAIQQNMTGSPGALQVAVAGDVNVNTDRRLRGRPAETLVGFLRTNPCPVTVGALGMGGDPEILANDFLAIAKAAGCPTQGIFHGVGFQPFDGIQIKFSPQNTPTNSVLGIIKALRESRLTFVSGPDPSQAAGSIYIYVGNKP